MAAIAESKDWRPGWVFDGRKNLYAPSMFLPQHETHFEASNPHTSCLLPCALMSTYIAGLNAVLWNPLQSVNMFLNSAGQQADLRYFKCCTQAAFTAPQLCCSLSRRKHVHAGGGI